MKGLFVLLVALSAVLMVFAAPEPQPEPGLATNLVGGLPLAGPLASGLLGTAGGLLGGLPLVGGLTGGLV